MCTRCAKRFSRSDNLTQHLRTHERLPGGIGSPFAGGGGGGGSGGMSRGSVDGDLSGGEGGLEDSSSRQGSVGDSEEEGMGYGAGSYVHHQHQGVDVYGNPLGGGGAGAPMDLSSYGVLGGQHTSAPYPMTDFDSFSAAAAAAAAASGDYPDSSSTQWATRVSDPAFSDSSSVMGSGNNSNRSSLNLTNVITSPTSYMRQIMPHPQAPPPPSQQQQQQSQHSHHSHSHSLSSSASAYGTTGGDEYSSLSLSAPSHKQSFDHAALYPPDILESAAAHSSAAAAAAAAAAAGGGGGIGPVRRHRSMTPSLIRNGDPIRRPMTSNSSVVDGSGGGGSGGSGGSPSSIASSSLPRGYHPYAYSATNSRAGSTHSSPSVHPTPLSSGDYGPRRSDSRNSSYSVGGGGGANGGGGGGIPGGLHEQMRQLMSMENPRRDSNGANVVFGDPNSLFSGGPSSELSTGAGAAAASTSSSPSSSLLSKPLSSTPPMMVGMMTNTNVQTDSPASFSVVDLPTMVGGYVQGGYAGGGSSTSQTQQQHQYDGYYTQQQTHSTL